MNIIDKVSSDIKPKRQLQVGDTFRFRDKKGAWDYRRILVINNVARVTHLAKGHIIFGVPTGIESIREFYKDKDYDVEVITNADFIVLETEAL